MSSRDLTGFSRHLLSRGKTSDQAADIRGALHSAPRESQSRAHRHTYPSCNTGTTHSGDARHWESVVGQARRAGVPRPRWQPVITDRAQTCRTRNKRRLDRAATQRDQRGINLAQPVLGCRHDGSSHHTSSGAGAFGLTVNSCAPERVSTGPPRKSVELGERCAGAVPAATAAANRHARRS